MTLINEIDDFISQTKEAQEIKRALAVKMILQGKSSREIEALLQVSHSFISKWKNRFIFEGIDSLKLQYKGSQGYLTLTQKQEVIEWLRAKEYLRLSDLQNHLLEKYQVFFASNQSYYDLFKAAKISWKKSQKKNPKTDEKLVAEKQEEIQEKLKEWQEEIEVGKLAVFMIDECHLLWGDLLGYVWGRTDMRIEIPIINQKERQTYYGGLDYMTKEFLVKEYENGKTENTIDFLNYLQTKRPGKRLAIFWDGASYHSSQKFQEYLKQINQDLPPEEWLINCTKFAPNAPEQNPVEDIWLQIKNFLRKFSHLCQSFKVVKWLFDFFANGQIFDFPKIYSYGIMSQSI